MPGGCHRGQTHIDFLVGVGVFLLTVGFVFAFVPGMVTPFAGGQEHPVVADRAGGALAEDLLADGSPSVLNTSCTLAFFGAASDAGCPFDAAVPLTERVGIDARYRLNVSLKRADSGGIDVLCTDGTGVQPCASGGDRLAAGPAIPQDSNSVTVATRGVYVDGTTAVLEVSVW